MPDISLQQFNSELNAGRALWPMPRKLEQDWNAADYQAAANSTFDALGRINRDYPNYRPFQSMLESSFERYTRKARQLRAAA